MKFGPLDSFFFFLKGMTLVTDRGFCVFKEGKSSVCKSKNLFKSKDGCQAACIGLDVCLAFNYNKVQSQDCSLITTAKPKNGCPNGFTWTDRGMFAKSVDDLEERSDSDAVCYAKIKIDKN